MIVSHLGPNADLESLGTPGTLELDSKAVGRGHLKTEEVGPKWVLKM
jgi:hypothetical protein